MESVNFLDLPEHILEKIFVFCSSEKNQILQLTLVNQFVRELIESSRSVLDQLSLNIHYRERLPINEILQLCLASKRKYRKITLTMSSLDSFAQRIRDPLKHLKNLVEKSATTARRIEISVTIDFLTEVIETLFFLENMKHLESLKFDIVCLSEIDDTVDLESILTQQFDKLKELSLRTSNYPIINSFKNVRNLEKLSLTMQYKGYPVDYSGYQWLFTNSQDTLKELTIGDHISPVSINNLATVLQIVKLNLKSLHLHIFGKYEIIPVDIFEWIECQAGSLEELEISVKFYHDGVSLIDCNFYETIARLLMVLKKLKVFKLIDDRDSYSYEGFYAQNIWNIEKLESLEINIGSNNPYVSKILQVLGNSLKHLKLTRFNFEDYSFGNLAVCLSSLTSFHIESDCESYENQYIFEIFRYMKQLKELSFEFSNADIIKPLLIDNVEALELPHIDKVYFSGFIDNSNILLLTDFTENASSLTVCPNSHCWSKLSMNEYESTLDKIVEKLPKLENLNYNFSNIDSEALLIQIKASLKIYNKSPEKFKLNGRKLF